VGKLNGTIWIITKELRDKSNSNEACSSTYGTIPLISYLIIWKCGVVVQRLEVFLFTRNKLHSKNEASLWDTFKKAFKRV
jgi:hypothetical protein